MVTTIVLESAAQQIQTTLQLGVQFRGPSPFVGWIPAFYTSPARLPDIFRRQRGGLRRTISTKLTPQCTRTGCWMHSDAQRLITVHEARITQGGLICGVRSCVRMSARAIWDSANGAAAADSKPVRVHHRLRRQRVVVFILFVHFILLAPSQPRQTSVSLYTSPRPYSTVPLPEKPEMAPATTGKATKKALHHLPSPLVEALPRLAVVLVERGFI